MNSLTFIMIERGFGWNLIRSIFATLDSVAFFLFAKIMGVMYEIASVTANADLSEFMRPLHARIYVILSIYMLFKVTISLITYVINPDAMTDKSKGAGKLVTRIITALVMLIFMPYAFTFMNDLQSHLIKNETVPKLVLGPGGNYSGPDKIGNDIALEAYDGVFIYEEGSESPTGFSSFDEIAEHINDPVDGNAREYKYHYIPLAGFAVGILLTLLTLSMCIDVAIRVFKLIILQLIAPIPILSYIDPNEKDSKFSKWLKMYASTWLEVFIRLFVIYFILLVIERLINAGGLLVGGTDAFVKIALVIGLLFFAKDAPKFMYKALGMDAPEKGLFSGLGSIMAAGAIGAGVIGGVASGYTAGKLSDLSNGKKPNFLKNVGAGLFGGLGGITTGIGAATSAKDHNARAVMEAMSKRNDAAIAAGAAGSTARGRTSSMLSRMLTGQTPAMKMDREISKMEAQKNALANVKSRMSGEMPKQNWTKGSLGIATDKNGKSIGDVNYKDFMSRMNAAKTAGQDVVDFYDMNGNALQISMVAAEQQNGFLLKNNENDYILNGVAHGDTVLESYINIAEETGITVTDRSSVNDNIDRLGIEITRAKAQNDTNKQNDRFAGKK